MDKTAQLISVIMPVRDPQNDRQHEWLVQSVFSILAQSEANLELILVLQQNTSARTDINALNLPIDALKDSRLRLINRNLNGIVNALNTGIAAARGNYVARMDADDISHPNRLSRQKDCLLRHPNVDLVSCGVDIFSEGAPIGRGSELYGQWLNTLNSHATISNSIFIESPLPHPTWFARRSLFKQLKGYRDVAWAEDYDFLLRAWQQGTRMKKLSDVLVQWREHEQRLTRTAERYSKQQFFEAKAWALSNTLAKNRNVIILGTGSNALRFHDALKNYNVSVDYFVDLTPTDNNRTKRQIPVIDYKVLLSYKNRNDALIASVITHRGARDKLHAWFNLHHYHVEKDYIFAG